MRTSRTRTDRGWSISQARISGSAAATHHLCFSVPAARHRLPLRVLLHSQPVGDAFLVDAVDEGPRQPHVLEGPAWGRTRRERGCALIDQQAREHASTPASQWADGIGLLMMKKYVL